MDPKLSVSYDSGAGNGPFGLGWSLSIPSVTRKTDKGLPLYQDEEESDTYIISGSEDLVPILSKVNEKWVRKPDRLPADMPEYNVQRYRPRIEGLFARIERWNNLKSGEIHWRSISKDNITTLYGKTRNSRIADPENPLRIFTWLICETFDEKGMPFAMNTRPRIQMEYLFQTFRERNRTDKTRSVNRYLKRIKYGNKTLVNLKKIWHS